jgi:hypothetical protein
MGGMVTSLNILAGGMVLAATVAVWRRGWPNPATRLLLVAAALLVIALAIIA